MTNRLRRVRIYTHRWLGIAGGVLFAAWFASGLVMMYARMPSLSPEERLYRLPLLDLSTASLTPAEAAGRRGLVPSRLRIGVLDDRPVYRFQQGRRWVTVFADDGQLAGGLSSTEAADFVRRFAPEHAATIRYDAVLRTPDQWTLQSTAFLPMHKVALGDPDGTFLYVSDGSGEVVMKMTRSSRGWAYLGAVLHWLYFTPFRARSALWSQAIIWLSIAGCVLTLSGLIWGVWRYSLTKRYRLKDIRSRTPYAGLIRWHHYAGLVFGLATFTWALSGGLSLDPWNWHPSTAPTPQQRDAVAGGPLRLDLLSVDRLQAGLAALAEVFPPKELDVVQFEGEPFLVAYRASAELRAVDDGPAYAGPSTFLSQALPIEHRLVSVAAPQHGVFTRFDDVAVVAAARAAMPGAAVNDVVWLNEYDAYYYHRDGARPLPVLRVRYADPRSTWLYLDPQRGLIALKEERLTRLNRWLYHGLHSLDFPFLYYRRPLWDAVVIVLCLGGIVLSVTTMAQGWHRLRRHGRRLGH